MAKDPGGSGGPGDAPKKKYVPERDSEKSKKNIPERKSNDKLTEKSVTKKPEKTRSDKSSSKFDNESKSKVRSKSKKMTPKTRKSSTASDGSVPVNTAKGCTTSTIATLTLIVMMMA